MASLGAPIGTPFVDSRNQPTPPWLAWLQAIASSNSGAQTITAATSFSASVSFAGGLTAAGSVTFTGPGGAVQVKAPNQTTIDLWNTTPGTPAGGSHWRLWADNVGGGGANWTFGISDLANNRFVLAADNSGVVYANYGLSVTGQTSLNGDTYIGGPVHLAGNTLTGLAVFANMINAYGGVTFGALSNLNAGTFMGPGTFTGALTFSGAVTVSDASSLSIGSNWVAYTPSITATSSPSFGVSISSVTECNYHRIGKLVHVKFAMQLALTGSPDAWFAIGLPIANTAGPAALHVFLSFGSGTDYVPGYGYAGANDFIIALPRYATMTLGTLYINGQFFYQVG